MYAITKKITDEQAEATILRTCNHEHRCIRRILWSISSGHPTPFSHRPSEVPWSNDELPILCAEACSLLVAATRAKRSSRGLRPFVSLGLDVHDNVSEMKISLKRVLYQVRDIVTLANCAIAGNAHMNVRESRQAALTHATLLDARDTRHGLNRGENFGDQFRSGLGVEDLVD